MREARDTRLVRLGALGPCAFVFFTLGCGTAGSAWIAENPHGTLSRPDAPLSTSEHLAASSHPDEEPPAFERPRTISLGSIYVEDGAGRLVLDEESRSSSSSYGAEPPRYVGGYGFPISPTYRYSRLPTTTERPTRPSRTEAPRVGGDFSRVSDYGPPMMDQTLPAPVWR